MFMTSIHPSILWRLSRIGPQGLLPRLPSPQLFRPALPGEPEAFPGQPRDIVSPAYPGSFRGPPNRRRFFIRDPSHCLTYCQQCSPSCGTGHTGSGRPVLAGSWHPKLPEKPSPEGHSMALRASFCSQGWDHQGPCFWPPLQVVSPRGGVPCYLFGLCPARPHGQTKPAGTRHRALAPGLAPGGERECQNHLFCSS